MPNSHHRSKEEDRSEGHFQRSEKDWAYFSSQKSWANATTWRWQWAGDTTELGKRLGPCSLEHPVHPGGSCERRQPSRDLPIPGWGPSLPVQQSLVAKHTRDEAGRKSAGMWREEYYKPAAPRPPLFYHSFSLPFSFHAPPSAPNSPMYHLPYARPCALMGRGLHCPPPALSVHCSLGLKMVLW